MLRVALAVTLAAAILAVALPVIETGGVQHSDQRVAAELDRLETVAETLAARNDPPPAGVTGARQRVTVQLPVEGWGTAGIEQFAVEPGNQAVRWRVTGGAEQVRRLTAVVLAGNSLRLDEGGPHRLQLTLRPDGSVRISRPDV
ncbi:MAG: hypothetical protein V5A55_04520 [Halovenus sp.]